VRQFSRGTCVPRVPSALPSRLSVRAFAARVATASAPARPKEMLGSRLRVSSLLLSLFSRVLMQSTSSPAPTAAISVTAGRGRNWGSIQTGRLPLGPKRTLPAASFHGSWRNPASLWTTGITRFLSSTTSFPRTETGAVTGRPALAASRLTGLAPARKNRPAQSNQAALRARRAPDSAIHIRHIAFLRLLHDAPTISDASAAGAGGHIEQGAPR
jgi:hypothetical protein